MKLKAVIFLLCYFTSSILLAQSIDSLNSIVSQKQLNEGTVKAHYLLAKIYTDKLDSTNAVDNYLAGIALSKKAKLFLWAGYGYNELGYLFELMNENNTALNYYYQAIKNGKQHNLYTSIGRAYSNIGFVKKNQGKFDQAILNYDSSITFYKLANHASEIANNMGNQAVLFQQLGNREKALKAFQTQLSIYDTLTNGERKKATPILNIGRIYLDQNNHDIAIKYFNESLLLSQKYKLLSAELLAQNNLGVAYFNKKEYTKAIEYIEKTILIAKKVGDKKQELEATTNLGACYAQLNEDEKALTYYKKSEKRLLELNDFQGLITNNINQSSTYGKLKKFPESIEYGKKALSYINNYQGSIQYKQNAYETIANVYKEIGNLKAAFEYQDSQIMARNAFLNETGNAALIELQTKYETSKKEYRINLLSKADSINSLKIFNQLLQIDKQKLALTTQQLEIRNQDLQLAEDSIVLLSKNQIINQKEAFAQQQQQKLELLSQQQQIQALELKQKNTLMYGLAVLVGLLCIGGFLFFRYKQAQQKALLQQKLLEQEKQATINILAAEEKERQRIATDLHDGVGQILTATWLNLQQINEEAQKENAPNKNFIERTFNLMDEGCKEVRSVSHNMMPNALLKKGLVDAVREFIQQINARQTQINLQTQGLQKSLPNHVEAVLYRVIQESVNNVIKHAQASRLDISINQEETGELDVLIEDNGKGFNVQEALKKDGIGLANIKSRIEYLKGTVDWDSNTNNGTLVAIHIPASNE